MEIIPSNIALIDCKKKKKKKKNLIKKKNLKKIKK